jgi:hypothetical protein
MEESARNSIFPKQFEAIVTSLKGKEGMYYLRGYIMLEGETFRFRGVAFGRFGGHNVSVEFFKNAKRRLRKKGLTEQDVENLEISAQVKILQGEMMVMDKKAKGA